MTAITRLHTLIFALVILALGASALLRLEPASAAIKSDWMRGATAQSFESHYNAAFPAKTFGTNLWATIEYRLFRQGRPSVVLGREGWLFSAEEFNTYPDAERRIEAHLALIGLVSEELARRGTALIVAPIPAKARLAAAYLDPAQRRPAPVHAALHTQLLDALRARGIAHVDLEMALQSCARLAPDEPLVLRTDTHWTPQGAACAARALVSSARASALPAAMGHGSYHTVIDQPAATHEGDLFRFLPLAPYFASLLPPTETIELQRTERLEETSADALLGDAPVPEIALVGTSYSANPRFNFVGALQQHFGGEVLSYAVDGKGPFVPMLQYLQDAQARQQPPKLLIWEIPERYLPVPFELEALGLPPEIAGLMPKPAAQPKTKTH